MIGEDALCNPRLTKRQKLIDLLQRDISTGRLGPGEQIPTEEHLAQRYGVCRTTVRSALAELRGVGLVVIKHPHGTFVADWRRTTPVDVAYEARWMVRMPTRIEVANLGLLPQGEPVVELLHPDGRTTVYGTRRTLFSHQPPSRPPGPPAES
jgi:DNA-binding GntR family transcriptional regulator